MTFNKASLLLTGFTLLLLTVTSCIIATPREPVRAGYEYETPPEYVFSGPPLLVPIPGTYVYIIPDRDLDIFFCRGSWYRPFRGHWYMGRAYNGPWSFIPIKQVPKVVIKLPPNYRSIPHSYRPIPNERVGQNWERWEREKYWDKHRDWREEQEEHRGRDRDDRIAPRDDRGNRGPDEHGDQGKDRDNRSKPRDDRGKGYDEDRDRGRDR